MSISISAPTLENKVPLGLQMIAATLSDVTEISMIKRWAREYKRYTIRKHRRSQVLEAINEGYDTLAEIAAHTGIPDASARRIIIELIGKNRVKSVKTKNHNHRIEIRFEPATVLD